MFVLKDNFFLSQSFLGVDCQPDNVWANQVSPHKSNPPLGKLSLSENKSGNRSFENSWDKPTTSTIDNTLSVEIVIIWLVEIVKFGKNCKKNSYVAGSVWLCMVLAGRF